MRSADGDSRIAAICDDDEVMLLKSNGDNLGTFGKNATADDVACAKKRDVRSFAIRLAAPLE